MAPRWCPHGKRPSCSESPRVISRLSSRCPRAERCASRFGGGGRRPLPGAFVPGGRMARSRRGRARRPRSDGRHQCARGTGGEPSTDRDCNLGSARSEGCEVVWPTSPAARTPRLFGSRPSIAALESIQTSTKTEQRDVTSYIPAEDRYGSMAYRRCGRSGLLLPAVSLGLWQNFGDDRPIDVQRAILRQAFEQMVLLFALCNLLISCVLFVSSK